MAITNLTNTTWKFKDDINTGLYSTKDFTINFVSNDQNFTSMYGWFPGSPNFKYNDTQVYNSNGWINEAYKFITIIDGEDVENSDLISFLESYAEHIKPLEFIETKTALKIYEDLSQEEFNLLEKEPNIFYQVNDVGIYKGEKLIAENGTRSSVIASPHKYELNLTTINEEITLSTEFLVPKTNLYFFYFVVSSGTGKVLGISQIMNVDTCFKYSTSNTIKINDEALLEVTIAPRTNEYQFNCRGIRFVDDVHPTYYIEIWAVKI